jgi:hypothetical protein
MMMENAFTKEPTVEEAAELHAAIQHIFEQIEQADARIKADQDVIDRLKAETRAMLAQLRTPAGA